VSGEEDPKGSTSTSATETRGDDSAKSKDVRPPRALTPLTASYPEGASGDAVVVVELTVDRRGGVSDARAIEGAEPFASAAVAVAYSWRFEPAVRGDAPVAARIRVAVEFVQERLPEPEPAARRDGQKSLVTPATSKAPPSSTEAPVSEVIVTGERPPPRATSLSRAEVRQLPGAFGDPIRALEVMPGVTPIISGLPFFYLRGSPPGNVGYYVDDIRVPYLYHFGLGPSVLNPALVRDVSVYPGGYPARYGRYAGGVLVARTTPPNPELHGEGNVRLFDAGALVEGGFDDGRGTILVGGRYSYTAGLISLFAPDVVLDYRDFQTRVSYELASGDRISLLGLGSFDLVGEEDRRGDVETQFGVEFYRADVAYEHRVAASTGITAGLTFGFDQSHFAEEVNARGHSLGGRIMVEHVLDEHAEFTFGVDGSADRYSVVEIARTDPDDPDPAPTLSSIFPTRTDLAIGVHAELRLRPLENFQIIPGLRADQYFSGSERATALEPRLSTRLDVTKTLTLVQDFGIAHQPPAFVVPVPGFVPALGNAGLQQSLQNSAGVELGLPASATLTTRLFHHVFTKVIDPLSTGDDASELDGTLGAAYGLEFSLKRPLTKNLGGLVSYTLSRSWRSSGRETFPAGFDRTHVLNAAVGYELGKNWRAGTRLVFYTGAPKSTTKDVEEHVENPPRDPPFFRVDARIEKRWPLGQKAFLALVFEWLNASLQREVIGGEPTGPITVPSVGLEGGF
jgi:TonB family protein